MTIFSTIPISLHALLRNKLRSLLTTLGVVIGVAAVIMLQALGRGATERVTGEISSLGSNMLFVIPGGNSRGMGSGGLGAPLFTTGDLAAIRRDASAVRLAAAVTTRSVSVVNEAANRVSTVYGVTPEFFAIRQWRVALGRILDDADELTGAKVCVLGETVRASLFGSQDPVGASVRFHDLTCEVVGVLEAKGSSTLGMDQDDLLIMPHSAFSRRIAGDDKLATISVSAVSEERTDEAKEQIQTILRARRHILPGEDDDFQVRDMREFLSLVGTVTGVLTTLLAGVAAISLVVGGIGIMNIMLVSVTERTREIGTRMAIGARRGDIERQFLVEAVVLSSIGGVVGILFGLGGALGLSRVLGLPFVISPGAVGLAFGVSALIGMVFGFFPARKAARLRPIEALRYE
jgi:putative ABC transport system permease protein